ncbi:MAG: hypothetical protein JWN32_4292, partial [Solirubrobacterales bacterium]|nr:hypothetical protein [Solirubrobacterales bacterium]
TASAAAKRAAATHAATTPVSQPGTPATPSRAAVGLLEYLVKP